MKTEPSLTSNVNAMRQGISAQGLAFSSKRTVRDTEFSMADIGPLTVGDA